MRCRTGHEVKSFRTTARNASVITTPLLRSTYSPLSPLRLALAMLSLILVFPASFGIAQTSTASATSQEKELEVYREYIPKLLKDLRECDNKTASDTSQKAYGEYIINFYRQATELRSERVNL